MPFHQRVITTVQVIVIVAAGVGAFLSMVYLGAVASLVWGWSR